MVSRVPGVFWARVKKSRGNPLQQRKNKKSSQRRKRKTPHTPERERI